MTYCWQHMWFPTYVGRPDKQGLLDCNTICFISVLYSIYSLSYSFSTIPFYPILCLSFSLTLVFNPFGFQPLSLSHYFFLSVISYFPFSLFLCPATIQKRGISSSDNHSTSAPFCRFVFPSKRKVWPHPNGVC